MIKNFLKKYFPGFYQDIYADDCLDCERYNLLPGSHDRKVFVCLDCEWYKGHGVRNPRMKDGL